MRDIEQDSEAISEDMLVPGVSLVRQQGSGVQDGKTPSEKV